MSLKNNNGFLLPEDHKAQHDGILLFWSMGDHVTYPVFIQDTFWAFGIPVEDGFNTINAKYCGKFNWRTRQVYDIKKLPPLEERRQRVN